LTYKVEKQKYKAPKTYRSGKQGNN